MKTAAVLATLGALAATASAWQTFPASRVTLRRPLGLQRRPTALAIPVFVRGEQDFGNDCGVEGGGVVQEGAMGMFQAMYKFLRPHTIRGTVRRQATSSLGGAACLSACC